jgi:hypothetical protein
LNSTTHVGIFLFAEKGVDSTLSTEISKKQTMYKICVFVPEAAAERVKQAMFEAGAGRIGDYDSCCWQVSGQGQFRPLAGSSPYIGEQDRTETVDEFRIEMVCADEFIKAAIAALKLSHPYEEPAYDVWKLEDL